MFHIDEENMNSLFHILHELEDEHEFNQNKNEIDINFRVAFKRNKDDICIYINKFGTFGSS